jgi:hypothetical protein
LHAARHRGDDFFSMISGERGWNRSLPARHAPMRDAMSSSKMPAMVAPAPMTRSLIDTFAKFGKASEGPIGNNKNADMRFSLHNHFGQGTTVAGVLALWLLLAGEVEAGTIIEGLAVAVAASLWVGLIES